ncbi:MAG: hypothetical protein K2X53_03730 [Alphaproteobacteria bacterium]|nr:hypothetical protein [Alphaproteobacteria bacterium]
MVGYTYLYPMGGPMVGCTYFPKQVRKDPQVRREAERDSVNERIHNPLFDLDMESLVDTKGKQNVRIYTVGHVNTFFDTLTQHTEIHTINAAPQLVESYTPFYEKLTHNTALDHIKTFKTYCCEDKLPLFVQCLPTLQITELDLNLVIHHEKELHLEGTISAIKNLWTAIQNHPTLTTLHLKGDFTPEQQTDLCKAIESNHVLISFHAEGQTLSTEMQEMIESFMVRNRNAK